MKDKVELLLQKYFMSLDALKNILTPLKSRCVLKSMVCQSQKVATFFSLCRTRRDDASYNLRCYRLDKIVMILGKYVLNKIFVK